MGGAAVLHGGSLYQLRAGTLPFTYPPFAAVVLTVLAAISRDAAVALLTVASAVALHTADVLPLWLPLAAAVAVTGLALAAAAGRRGDEAAGFSLCAVTGLLVSPISWTHHWVIAIPALLVAGTAVSGARRAGKTAAARLGAAGIAAVAVTGWTRLAQATPASGWLAMSAPALACSAVYVLIGVLTLALVAWYRLRHPQGAAGGADRAGGADAVGQPRTAGP